MNEAGNLGASGQTGPAHVVVDNAVHRKRKTLGLAYLWWALSVFGLFGGHYFYLGLPDRGMRCIFTLGYGVVGAMFVDPFRLPSLVRRVNAGTI